MERLAFSNEELTQLLSRASNGEDIQLLLDSISKGGENTELHVTGATDVIDGRKKHPLIGENEELNKQDTFILKAQMNKLAISETSIMYQNQRKAANDIISEFTQDRNTLLVAAQGKTQSGKTGNVFIIMEATDTILMVVPVCRICNYWTFFKRVERADERTTTRDIM